MTIKEKTRTHKEFYMTQEQAKQWLPEITHWANGGTIYVYDKLDNTWNIVYEETWRLDQIYVIEDKNFEARKAFALGEPVEIYNKTTGLWSLETNPKWGTGYKHRPKPKKWYDNIPEEGVLCWVWDKNIKHKTMRKIFKYYRNRFWNKYHCWDMATPIKPEECWKDKK